MSAYFVVEIEITNREAMKPYRDAVPATLTQYGGRFLPDLGRVDRVDRGWTGVEKNRHRGIRR